jgi:hypothetical protein
MLNSSFKMQEIFELLRNNRTVLSRRKTKLQSSPIYASTHEENPISESTNYPDSRFEWIEFLFRIPGSFSKSVMMTGVFRSFPQSLQSNAGKMPQIRPRPHLSTSILTQHSLIVPPFVIIQCELLRALLNEIYQRK